MGLALGKYYYTFLKFMRGTQDIHFWVNIEIHNYQFYLSVGTQEYCKGTPFHLLFISL